MRPLPRPKPVAPLPPCARLRRPEAAAKGLILFVGLDVHNDSIAVSLAPSDSSEVRRYGIIGGTLDAGLRLDTRRHCRIDRLVLEFYVAHPSRYQQFQGLCSVLITWS